jgi:PhoPQ-activated pathogenicity-related protein
MFRKHAHSLVAIVLVASLTANAAFAAKKDKKEVAAAPESTGLSITALDRYVAAPDPNFKWELAKTIPGEGYTAYVLKMVSQQWLTEKEVDHPIWWHWLTVIRPAVVDSDKGLLFISGGNNEGTDPPSKVDAMLANIAVRSKTIVGELRMVPNQPLVFADDPDKRKRTEDSMIAYTWDEFLRTGDEKWPARLPMTKAAVRAMDAVTQFTSTPEGGGKAVKDFVVAGGSKRGWTTWTTAAVDNRVIAIAPLVIDLLNIVPSFQHHFQVYGRYANAVQDYVAAGIMDRQETPEYRRLMDIEEPYQYRERFHIPKYMVYASGDQFFVPDSWQFYWNDLQGEKYLRYVPNTDHGLGGSDAPASLLSWYDSIVHNVPRPRFAWHVDADGATRIKTIDTPKSVLLWQATDPDARDFRLERIKKAWTSSPLSDQGGGVYTASIPAPAKGWSAYFVELTYDSGIEGVPFKFTTGTRVMPDTYPAPQK